MNYKQLSPAKRLFYIWQLIITLERKHGKRCETITRNMIWSSLFRYYDRSELAVYLSNHYPDKLSYLRLARGTEQ